MLVPGSSYLNFTSKMTAEIWVKPYDDGISTGTSSVIKPIFHKEGKWNKSFLYAISTINRYGKRQVACIIETTDDYIMLNPRDSSVGLIEDVVWSHVAMTYDAAGGADNLKLYLNGQLIASETVTGDIVNGDGLFRAGIMGHGKSMNSASGTLYVRKAKSMRIWDAS